MRISHDEHCENRRGPTLARERQIQMRIARAERRGDLTRREAYNLRQRLWQIKRIEARYRYDGRLSRWERVDLDRRLDNLSAQIRYERHDADYYRPRY